MINSGEGLTVADYEALPEEVCRRIEIVDGGVVVSPSPARVRQRIARRLANAVEAVDPNRFGVETDIDLRGHVAGFCHTDRADKPTEYATVGIQHFWRVEHDDQTINVFRYQLDPMTRTYAL